MARKTRHRIQDISRYTGSPSRPPSFDDEPYDDSITSGMSFFLLSLVAFLAISFGAITFGTQNIEEDLEARSAAMLRSAGFTEVDVRAEGATVYLSGSIDTNQSEQTAFSAVEGLTGVRTVEGKLWPVFSGELEDIVVTGDVIEINWTSGSVAVRGNVASEDRRVFVSETLAEAFTSVSIEELTVLEGLEEEPGWLGASLGLLLSLNETMHDGKMIVDPNGGLLIVGGEVETKEIRNELNAQVTEVAEQLGFKVNPAIRALKEEPTVEDIEELQVNLDALIAGKVVEFASKSFELTEVGENLLDEILAALAKAPEIRVRIEGHTDSRGSADANQQLSEDRANAVLAYLLTRGELAERFDVIGYGETDPTASNDTSDGRARNRRIEFVALEGTS